jgi:proteasome accessory factor A
VGTTSLVLDLLEMDQMPKVVLADAVLTFRSMSHQPDGPWLAPLADGRCTNAVELLFQYYEAARREFRGRDTETDVVLEVWQEVLSALSKQPEALVGRVDWITKRWLFQQFIDREKIPWIDPWLRAQDLEFHHVDPARNLGLALAQTPGPWDLTAADIAEATRIAPTNTRAQIRSHIMHQLKHHPIRYFVDWEVIDAEGINSLNLLNPFEASPETVEGWCRQLNGTKS